MKKVSFLFTALLVIASFTYYYFSAPKVLERRLDSLTDSLTFGAISLGGFESDADNFATHFANEVEFSGAGNSIITGTVTPSDLRELYLNQLRAAAKKCQAKRTGDFFVKLQSPDRAEMDATIMMDLVLRDNIAYPQTVPVRFHWEKKQGKWLISEVQLQEPIGEDFDF